MSLKMLDGNDLPHELLLTTRQRAKLRNAFNNNMNTDIKLSRVVVYYILEQSKEAILQFSKGTANVL